MGRVLAAAAIGLILAGPALAPGGKSHGPPAQRLTKAAATKIFLQNAKVADWLDRYPTKDRQVEASFDKGRRVWTVNVWWGPAGEIATGKVDDASGTVTEAWTGPQVAWKMARGYKGAFGGERINSYPVWLGFCAVFLVGLVDWRRLRSLRNLDLLAFLSFSASLWFFNRGDIFTSVPLVYPPLLYLLLRCIWVGTRGRASRGRTVWPAWVLLAATVFLMGFRIGLNA